MRIRKNAKLNGGSSVLLENFQSHVTCQLNQSPWDVIPFGSDSPQFEGEGSFTGNGGSPGDSIGAVESVASMMDTEDKSLPKIEDMVVDDNDDNGIAFDKAENNTSSSCQCKNQPKQGQSFCEHHNLSLIHATSSSKKPTAAGTRRATKPRAAKKNTPSSNPYEFYYYSGFGPLWGKRRGDRNGGGGNKNEAKGGENSTITEANATPPTSATTIQSSPCSSSQIDNEGFDYDDEDDDDEDDDDDEEEVEDGNEESGKKRTRKPVKARSLKSLM